MRQLSSIVPEISHSQDGRCCNECYSELAHSIRQLTLSANGRRPWMRCLHEPSAIKISLPPIPCKCTTKQSLTSSCASFGNDPFNAAKIDDRFAFLGLSKKVR